MLSVNVSSPSLGETRWYGSMVTVRMLGDANSDGHCGIGDLTMLGGTWQKTHPDLDYKWQADFNGDGRCSIGDLSILGMNWQQY